MGYLILSRRLNERIRIGKNVEIMVADIYTNKQGELVVDIGLTGPKDVKFLRMETYLEDLKRNGIVYRNKSR